jgi:hypothetical protein
MPSYRVYFINGIPRNEKLFRCCQRSLIIRSARTSERAIETAKKKFARLEGIRDWKFHAALIEIEPIEVEAKLPVAPVQRKLRPSYKRAVSPKRAYKNTRPLRWPLFSASESLARRLDV